MEIECYGLVNKLYKKTWSADITVGTDVFCFFSATTHIGKPMETNLTPVSDIHFLPLRWSPWWSPSPYGRGLW